MTPEALVAAVRASGFFAQVRQFGKSAGVEAAHTDAASNEPRAPLVKAVRTRGGSWALTVFGESAVGVPDPVVLPAAIVDALREMGTCLDLPPAVVEQYGLVPLDPSELTSGDN